jgi:hypothetical protein
MQWWQAAKLALATTAAVVAGCETALELGLDAEADVSFQVEESDDGLFGGSPPNEVRSGGHVVTITQATVTASRVALRGTTEATHDDEVKFDLPVRGGMVTPVRMQVAAGTFDELELRVREVRLRGTYDGRLFDVAVRTDATAELEVSPAVRIESRDRSNLTVRVDLRHWFRADGGDLIDPTRLEFEEALRARLRTNLEASLRAFLDLNADGQAG